VPEEFEQAFVAGESLGSSIRPVQPTQQHSSHCPPSWENLARSILPSSSALRGLILSEPDCPPKDEAAIKVRMYSKPLF